VADRLAHVHQENRQALTALLDLIGRRRAADKQQQVRMFRTRNPHFLTAHDIHVALAHGHRLHLRRVGARGGLADTERLKTQFARRNRREVPALLFR
jgi:hypothetical protein